MEGYIDMILAGALNLRKASVGAVNAGVAYSLAFSVIFCIILTVLPIWVGIFYWRRRDLWADEEFDEKWGAPLEGLEKSPMRPNPNDEHHLHEMDQMELRLLVRQAMED